MPSDVYSIHISLLILFSKCNSVTPTIKVHCPSQDTNVTILVDPFPGNFERKNESQVSRRLEDFNGFDVQFFIDFIRHCPINYTVAEIPFSQHDEYLKNMTTISDFKFIRYSHVPRCFKEYHTSLAVVNTPSVVVYYKRTTQSDSQSIWLRHGFIYIIASTIGSIILVMLMMLERKSQATASIKEVVWNFILSPFGLCGDSLMSSIPLKVFTLTWLTVWFLIAGNFWAEMSSSMTVSKLRENINSFEDVWRSNREFFWTEDVKNMPKKIVNRLRERYESFASPAHRAYEKNDIGESAIPWKNITSDLLEKDQVLLSWSVDLFIQLSEKLRNDPNVVIKKDWSVATSFHYSTSKGSTDILDALNEFIYDRRATGKMEEEENRWFGINRTFHKKPKETDIKNPLDVNGTLSLALQVAMVGMIVSLITSCASVITRKAEPVFGDGGGSMN